MKASAIAIIIVAVITLIVSFSGFTVVNTGEAGMKVTFGEVVSKSPLTEGIYFYNPITTSMVKYDVKNRVFPLKTYLYTKDNQPAEFAVSVTYHLLKDKVIDLHKTTGKEYEDKLIVKNVNGYLKDIVGQIPTDDIIVSRNIISEKLKADVTELLSPYGIEIVFVNIDNVDYSDAYEKAIEAKAVALQNSQKEKNETTRIAEATKQKVLQAEADAKSVELAAKAEAGAISIKAEAEAKGIQMKNEALNSSPELVKYMIATKWDGKMPTYMMGDNATPLTLFNVDKKDVK